MKHILKRIVLVLCLALGLGLTAVNCGGGDGIDCQASCKKSAECENSTDQTLIDFCVAACNGNREKCKDVFVCTTAKTDCTELQACGTCTIN